MSTEIERKFAIKKLPQNLKILKVIDIIQNTIYKDKYTMVRLRKTKNKDYINNKEELKYIYTLKTRINVNEKDKTNKIGKITEIESYISEEEYNKIVQNKKFNTINKTRIVADIQNNLKAEIDIYRDYLDGMLTLEVEFPNSEEANNFKIPEWFGEELGYEKLSNGKLAQMTREKLIEIVGEDFLDKNKKIIEKINEIIQ